MTDSNTQNSTQNTEFLDSSELKIEILKEGQGGEVKKGDMINVHYTGMLLDGTIFDSSIPREETFEFVVGSNTVIQGWELGVLGMKVGELRRLTIPSDMAYGDRAVSVIPANSTLVFDIELVSID